MTASSNKEMGKLRSFLWPIYKGEYKKFIPMFIIFFLISFNYNILRTAKDTLIITAPSSGAEAIPFIKVWVMLPLALFLTYVFSKLSNRYGRDKVFYIMLSIFLGFFALFTFFLYPLRDSLHPYAFADNLSSLLPIGLNGFVALIRNWSFTCFYAMSELWGAIVFSVLFWGYANDVTSVNEAKRFYTLFGLGANIAGIFAGQVAILLSSNIYNSKIAYGTTAWEQSVLFLMTTVIIIGFVIMLIYRYLNTKLIKLSDGTSKKESSFKMSLKENFAYIAKSKYLICIAIIVLAYNITINLGEILWKNQVKALYSNPADYNIYMGHVMSLMGVISTVTALFISGNLLRRFSWTFNALIPPFIILAASTGFFAFFLLGNTSVYSIAAFFGSTPLLMSVLFGTILNCMSRSAKYTIFDTTKEMSFIPLGKESKLKGKAAIDGVGSRIGKSGGSVIYQGLLIPFSSIQNCAPYIAVIFLSIVGVWIVAARSLGRQFNALVAHNEKLTIPEEPEKAKEAITVNE